MDAMTDLLLLLLLLSGLYTVLGLVTLAAEYVATRRLVIEPRAAVRARTRSGVGRAQRAALWSVSAPCMPSRALCMPH